MKLVTCLKCGWVHMGRTLAEHGEDKPSRGCFNCGAYYTGMREYKEGDCPTGCTIQSILLEDK